MSAPVCLAEEVGESVGRGEVLLGAVPACEERGRSPLTERTAAFDGHVRTPCAVYPNADAKSATLAMEWIGRMAVTCGRIARMPAARGSNLSKRSSGFRK